MREHVFRFSKIKMVFLNAAVFAVISFLFSLILFDQDKSNSVWGFVIMPLVLLAFGFLLRKSFGQSPALILNEEGLTDHSTGVSIGFVPWSDIIGIKQSEVKGQKFLSVLVYDPEKYLSKGGLYKRVFNWLAHKFYGSPVNIGASLLNAKPAEIVTLIEAYRSGNVPNPAPVPTLAETPELSPEQQHGAPRDPRYDYSDMFDRNGRY